MSYNELSECCHQSYSKQYCLNCGAINSSQVFALKHPKYCYKPELNPKQLFEKMRERDNNDISIEQLNKKYIEKRHDIIRVLRLINTRLNFNSQTVFLAICYLDEVVFKCHTITKTSEFLLIGLSCLLLAAKFNENDPNVPEMRKFIVVFCELIKYKYRYRLEDLRIGEIFVLKQLDYKLNYYSIYHYIVFFFAHGIITDRMLIKHFNDLAQSSLSTSNTTTTSSHNSLKRKRMIKVLEQIYVQAREIMDVLLESEEHCVFGRDNHIAAIVILKTAIENIFSYETISQEDDMLHLVYGIDENSNAKYEEIRKKIKAAHDQRYSTKIKGSKEFEMDQNTVLLKSSVKGNIIKEKKTFDANNINNKILHLYDYDNQHLLTNNEIGIANSRTTKGRREIPSQDNVVKEQQREFHKKESSNIESVREELFTITTKIRKRACSSNKDKNKEPQTGESNNLLVVNQNGLVDNSNNTSTNKPYSNYLQPHQSNQNPNDILDKTKFIFGQTRNPKQIILYSGSVHPNSNTSKPRDNTTGLLHQTGIDTLDNNQSPSTIIINNNININIQDKHLSSSQFLKKGDEQLYLNDLRRSHYYPSRLNNNFGTYYNYNSGNSGSSNQLNYYALNQNKYGSNFSHN